MAFVKLNRDVVESEIYLDDKLLAFYVRLLLMCRIKPCVINGVYVGSGQLFTSVRKLSGVLELKPTNTLKLLNTLKENHLISIEKYSEGSLITVLGVASEKRSAEKREHPDDCSRERSANTLRTPTLLYKKKEKNDEKGVRARVQNEFSCEDPSEAAGDPDGELSERLTDNLPEKADHDPEDPEKHTKFSLPTREQLIDKYGRENVREYEYRFECWKSRQKKPVEITVYEAIDRWMRKDKVTKPVSEAAFNTEEIMRRIIENYNR